MLVIIVVCGPFRTVGCFSPLAAYIASSCTVRTSSLERGFQASCRLVPPSSVIEVCGVFSHRVLPFRF